MYLSSYITFLSPFLGYSNPQLDKDKDDTVVIVAATLAAVLFIAIIVLGVVLFLRRRKRQSHGNLLVTTGQCKWYKQFLFRLLFPFVSSVFWKGFRARRDYLVRLKKGFRIYPSEIKPHKTCRGMIGSILPWKGPLLKIDDQIRKRLRFIMKKKLRMPHLFFLNWALCNT